MFKLHWIRSQARWYRRETRFLDSRDPNLEPQTSNLKLVLLFYLLLRYSLLSLTKSQIQ